MVVADLLPSISETSLKMWDIELNRHIFAWNMMMNDSGDGCEHATFLKIQEKLNLFQKTATKIKLLDNLFIFVFDLFPFV